MSDYGPGGQFWLSLHRPNEDKMLTREELDEIEREFKKELADTPVILGINVLNDPYFGLSDELARVAKLLDHIHEQEKLIETLRKKGQ